MTPEQLGRAAGEIHGRYPDGIIYACEGEDKARWPHAALLVDVDKVWSHQCTQEERDADDCDQCYGEFRIVARIDVQGDVHWIDTPEAK